MGSRQISRRKFIGILGGLAVAAGAAGVLWEVSRPKPRPTRPFRANAYTKEGRPLVSIVKGRLDGQVEAMVREAVEALGGMGRIVSSGKTVVVKPAVLASDPDCAPDPSVVAAVIKLAREAGGSVTVAESSGGGDTTYSLSRVGITSAAEQAGARVKALPQEDEVLMEVPSGLSLRTVRTYPTVYGCDVLISVPRLKRHSSTDVTISLKNMMGAIPNSEKSRFHSTNLSQCIADLNTALKPDLTVVDATLAMTRTGPTGGEMVRMDTVMASGDPVAVDKVAALRLQQLEKSLGIPTFEPAEVRHINAAAALGVGTSDPDRVTIVEESVH